MISAFYTETPLILNPRLARVFGVIPALILQQIHYWLQKSKEFHDGKYWVYNTIESWLEQIPVYRNPESLRQAFKKLENDGLIETGNYNQNRYDRTKWYTINYAVIDERINKQEMEANEKSSSNPTNSGNESKQIVGMKTEEKLESLIQRLPETTTETTKDAVSQPPKEAVKQSSTQSPQLYTLIRDTVDKGYQEITKNRLPWNARAKVYSRQIKTIMSLLDSVPQEQRQSVFTAKARKLRGLCDSDKWYREQGYTFATLISAWDKLRIDIATAELPWRVKYDGGGTVMIETERELTDTENNDIRNKYKGKEVKIYVNRGKK